MADAVKDSCRKEMAELRRQKENTIPSYMKNLYKNWVCTVEES